MATYNPAPIPESDTSAKAQLDPSHPTSQQNMNTSYDAQPSTRVQEQDASREGGSFVTGQDKFKAQGTQETESVGSAMPKSVVADHDYPNVPERAEPQQGPGTGQTVGTEKVPFKDQVQGYAKKFHGQVFGNSDEKEFGEKKLAGDI